MSIMSVMSSEEKHASESPHWFILQNTKFILQNVKHSQPNSAKSYEMDLNTLLGSLKSTGLV